MHTWAHTGTFATAGQKNRQLLIILLQVMNTLHVYKVTPKLRDTRKL